MSDTTVQMPTLYTCSECGVRWALRHECPNVSRSTSAPKIEGSGLPSQGASAATSNVTGETIGPGPSARIDKEEAT